MTRGPVLIDLDENHEEAAPQNEPAVPDLQELRSTAALQRAVALAGRRPSRIARWFWTTLVALVGFIVSLTAWDYVNALIARSPLLGGAITVLLGLFCLILVVIALRELSAFARLREIDSVQDAAKAALASNDLEQARNVTTQLDRLYRRREDLRWGQQRFNEAKGDILDADGLIGLAETTLLDPLDNRAAQEVESAARQVATVTALVPLALADVLTALTANIRMIRRIAEIYGGRSGVWGSWRLTRAVFAHLVATGAVAVGDDLIGSIAGGGVVSKLSRRFGEGVINGALTARVGVAAIEVCRPLPFHQSQKPSVTTLVRKALTGLFQRGAA